MCIQTVYMKLRQTLLVFLFFVLGRATVSGQGQYVELKGYDKASYTVSQAGKYMHTWLVAGPVPVSADSSRPEDAAQEKAFKNDPITHANIVPGKAIKPLSANNKEFNWQLISPSTDIINLDEIFQEKNYAYAYAVAEIK